jgi:hypothetical protein
MPSFRRITGIDPSIRGTGIVTITVGRPYENSYYPIVNYDTWETLDKISRIVAGAIASSDLVVIEKNLEMAATFRTSIILAKLNVICGLTIRQAKKPYLIVAPIQLRSFVGDIPKGKKAKDVMPNVNHLNHDEVDALVLAMIGGAKSGVLRAEARHKPLLSRLKIQNNYPA